MGAPAELKMSSVKESVLSLLGKDLEEHDNSAAMFHDPRYVLANSLFTLFSVGVTIWHHMDRNAFDIVVSWIMVAGFGADLVLRLVLFGAAKAYSFYTFRWDLVYFLLDLAVVASGFKSV